MSMKIIIYLTVCFFGLNCMDDEPPAKKKKIDDLAWIDDLWDSYAQEQFPQYIIQSAFEAALKHNNYDIAERFLKKGILYLRRDNCHPVEFRHNNAVEALELLISKNVFFSMRKKHIRRLCKLIMRFCPLSNIIKDIFNYNNIVCTGLLEQLYNNYKESDKVGVLMDNAYRYFLTTRKEELRKEGELVIILALWRALYCFIKFCGNEQFSIDFCNSYTFARLCGVRREFDEMPFMPEEAVQYKKLVCLYESKHGIKQQLQNNQRLAPLCGTKFLFT